jgi:hypothetical protein
VWATEVSARNNKNKEETRDIEAFHESTLLRRVNYLKAGA